MMVTPYGQSRFELSRFITPSTISDYRTAPVNVLGYLRVIFIVENIDELVSRFTKQGAVFISDIVNYENTYRLCYLSGIEGLLIGPVEELSVKRVLDIFYKI